MGMFDDYPPGVTGMEPEINPPPPKKRKPRPFEKRWPNHCRNCGGWGHFRSTFDPDPGACGSGHLDDSDPCEALAETQCHRCGEHGLTDEGEGPCKFCGWNYDDGVADE